MIAKYQTLNFHGYCFDNILISVCWMVAVLLEPSELHVAIHESQEFRSTWSSSARTLLFKPEVTRTFQGAYYETMYNLTSTDTK